MPSERFQRVLQVVRMESVHSTSWTWSVAESPVPRSSHPSQHLSTCCWMADATLQ